MASDSNDSTSSRDPITDTVLPLRSPRWGSTSVSSGTTGSSFPTAAAPAASTAIPLAVFSPGNDANRATVLSASSKLSVSSGTMSERALITAHHPLAYLGHTTAVTIGRRGEDGAA